MEGLSSQSQLLALLCPLPRLVEVPCKRASPRRAKVMLAAPRTRFAPGHIAASCVGLEQHCDPQHPAHQSPPPGAVLRHRCMGSHHLVPKYARPNSTPKRSAGAAPCPMSCAPRMMAAVPAPGLTVRCQPLCHALTATVLCLGATRAMGQGKALQHLGGLQEGWGAHRRGRGVRMGRSLSPAQCRPLPAPHEVLLSPGLHCTSCLRGHLQDVT